MNIIKTTDRDETGANVRYYDNGWSIGDGRIYDWAKNRGPGDSWLFYQSKSRKYFFGRGFVFPDDHNNRVPEGLDLEESLKYVETLARMES